MAAKSKPNEIRIARIYDAPVKAVWDAWTDPKQVAQWWGPRGFTITTHEKDLRPGGSWSYTMHGPDGTDYENTTQYFEVEPYSRLVYDHGGHKDRPPLFRVTATFAEVKGKTHLVMTMAFSTAAEAAESRTFIKKAGGEGTWDRLGEYLAKTVAKKDMFLINRSFDAPINVMYDMWTNPEHFAQWMPPTGFSMKFLRADIRPGGSTFYKMTDGGKITMYGKARYLEFTKPTRILYTQEFCDEHEQMAQHPFAPTWPAAMLTTVTLTEEEPGRTRVTVSWEPHGATTPAELATFLAARAGMTGGWTGSFDKLEGYLASRS